MDFQLILVSNLTLSSPCESTNKQCKRTRFEPRALMHLSKETLTRDLMALKSRNARIKSTMVNNITQCNFIHAKYDEGFNKVTGLLDIDEFIHEEDNSSILYNMGKTQENLGNYRDALGSYFDALIGAENRFMRNPDDCFILVSILRSIGQIYYLHGNFAESLSAYSIARDVNSEGFKHIQNKDSAFILCCIGMLKYHICRASNNCDTLDTSPLDDSLQMMRFLFDDDHVDIATTLNNLGSCYLRQGKYAVALSSFKEANRIRRIVCGEDHLDVAATFYNLGEANHRMGDMINSNKFYCEFLRTSCINDMWYYPDVARALHKLGDICREQKNNNLMFTSLKDALHIELQLHGPKSVQVADTLNKLGSSYVEVEDYKSAKIVYEQGLRIQLELNGLCSSNVLCTLINIAEVCKLKDYEDSLVAYQQVLHVQKSSILQDTNNIKDIFETLSNLGFLYNQKGELRQAYQMCKEALLLKEDGVNDIEDTEIKTVLGEIFMILMELKEFELAIEYELQALHIEKKSELDQKYSYQLLYNIASIYKECNKYDKALMYYEKSYEMEVETLGFWNRNIAISFSCIAEMHFMLNNFETALEKFKKALSIIQARNEMNDMFAADLFRDIGNAYTGIGDDKNSMEMLVEASRIHREIGLSDDNIAILTRGLDEAIDGSGPDAAAAA